eukprot:snap_masked-scaffold_51-processed-gene-1.25-mRNA-1 protein AED:1.00 eAED:1.00 QI:0/-1/0/0/-1/1/1/0/493
MYNILMLLWLLGSSFGFQSPDVMIGRRRKVDGFSLGPAPFPMFKDMEFELFGDAFIKGDSVKVTDDSQSQKGAIWSKESYELSKSNDMQIDLKFRVGGRKDALFGDGFALWFVTKRYRGVGGNALGGPNKWDGLGVFFDTFKNDELRGKKHPYVYAVMNDGKTNYGDIKSKDIEGQGCHIPMRTKTSEDMEATIARVTYRKRTLSLVLQPFGASDWVQCFQVEEVDLPSSGFLGVTAMTGEVTDNHQMISVELFNRIFIDPYKKAIEYNLGEIQNLWQDLKHSGDVAREFESWEQQIEEEVDFSLSDNYVDDYYDAYYGADYYDDSKYYMSEEEFDESVKYEEPSYKNNYQEKIRKGKRDDRSKSTHRLSAEEQERIDEMIRGTPIAKEIQKLAIERRKRIHALQKHIESEFEEKTKEFSNLARTLRRKEFQLSSRISKVGRRLNIKLDQLYENEEKRSGAWMIPFAFIVLLVLTVTGLSYNKFRQDMKSHLL